MVVSCVAYVHLKVEVKNSLPHSYIQTPSYRDFYFVSEVTDVFSSPLISYALEVFIYLHMKWFRFCFPITKIVIPC